MSKFLILFVLLVSYILPYRDKRLFRIFLDSRILLSKLPRQSLNAIHNPLEVILLLTRNLTTRSRRVIFLITPLDLKRSEVELGIYAIDILVVI
jgi:hypothetical protein